MIDNCLLVLLQWFLVSLSDSQLVSTPKDMAVNKGVFQADCCFYFQITTLTLQ